MIPKDVKEGTIAPYLKMELVYRGGQWLPISAYQL
jgi:hypothetical protein